MKATHCGLIAIVGRPNVGKSTLLNRLVGTKISITSHKPQTTRQVIRGIRTEDDVQYVFVDTPGFQTQHGGALNRSLNRAVRQSLNDIDVAVLVLSGGELTEEDHVVARGIPAETPKVIVINKADRLPGAARMLPFLKLVTEAYPGCELVPLSARSGKNVPALLRVLRGLLPEQSFMYDAEDLTDRDERFLAAETVREKLFRSMHEEVPYGAVVVIDSFKEEGRLRRIAATIFVEKESHKAMVVGAKGERLKSIGTAARRSLETLFGGKVFLELWVKPRPGWVDNPAELHRFGFD